MQQPSCPEFKGCPSNSAPAANEGSVSPVDEELMTASGGNLISSEIMRNKRAPPCGVAPIEHAELSMPRAVRETLASAVRVRYLTKPETT